MNPEAKPGTAPQVDASALLTEEEKRRIIAEVRFREELQRQLSPEEKAMASLARHLNSPFVITLIGGLIISLVTANLQHRYAETDRRRDYIRIVREKKYELLRTFAADMDLQIRCDAWLNNEMRRLERSDKKGAYAQQQLHGYQDVLLVYLKTPQTSAYAEQIRALFDSQDVKQKLDNLLRKKVAAVQEAGKLLTHQNNQVDIQSA